MLLRSLHVSEGELHVLDQVDTSFSEEGGGCSRKVYFPVEKIQTFLKSIRVEDQNVNNGEAPPSTSRGPRSSKRARP